MKSQDQLSTTPEYRGRRPPAGTLEAFHTREAVIESAVLGMERTLALGFAAQPNKASEELFTAMPRELAPTPVARVADALARQSLAEEVVIASEMQGVDAEYAALTQQSELTDA